MDHRTVPIGPFPALLITHCYNPHGRWVALRGPVFHPICHVTLPCSLALGLESAMWLALANGMLANMIHPEAWIPLYVIDLLPLAFHCSHMNICVHDGWWQTLGIEQSVHSSQLRPFLDGSQVVTTRHVSESTQDQLSPVQINSTPLTCCSVKAYWLCYRNFMDFNYTTLLWW